MKNRPRRRTALRGAVAAGVLGVVFSLGAASAASAHDGLIESSPAADSTVSAEVTSIDLEFSQDFLDLGSATSAFAVQVTNETGKFYNLGCIELDGSLISTEAALGESGEYTVLWQVVSSDGHPTSDSFSFTYERPETVTAVPGAVSGFTCPEASTPAPSADPSSAVKGASAVTIPWVIGGAALVLVGAVVAVVLIRRGRRAGA